jgi:hypothetical protein
MGLKTVFMEAPVATQDASFLQVDFNAAALNLIHKASMALLLLRSIMISMI